jgi:hypothetical protein
MLEHSLAVFTTTVGPFVGPFELRKKKKRAKRGDVFGTSAIALQNNRCACYGN